MWKRNLLFVAVCLGGIGTLAANLLQKNRIEEAQKHVSPRNYGDDFLRTVATVNAEFREHWAKAKLTPAGHADDLAICRRLALGLAGTIPSLEEIRAVEHRSANERVEWWTARLLADRRHADYFGERFARVFVGTDDGPPFLFRRRRFRTWLSDQFHANTPYSKIVQELLADEGLWTDRPAVNFVTATLDPGNDNQPDPKKLAGRTSRAFLGMRIDCLNCHSDRLGTIQFGESEPRGGLQSDFHQLAAFFGQVQRTPLGMKDRDGKYRVKYLKAEKEEIVLPAVPFNERLLTEDGSRRERLATWITHPENKPFARTIVNRVWALMFGRPLVQPIDDIPLHGPFPPGLETLATDFVAHGHDLQRLICLIAATDAFRLDSRADFEVTPEHEAAWAVFPLTRLRPEQMAGAMIQACSLKTIDANAHIIFQLQRDAQLNEFIKRYGDMGEDEFTDRGGTVTQRLLMMNGELVKDRTKNDLPNASMRIAMLVRDDNVALDTAYLAVLSRRPSAVERESFAEEIRGTKGEPRHRAFEDLYWTLVNSTEFSWNH